MEKAILTFKDRVNWPVAAIQIVSIMIIGLSVFLRNMGNLDEIWVFSYGKNLADGLLPYKDINVCTTPLALSLLACAMNIFGYSLWTLRGLTFVSYSLLFLLGSYWLQRNSKSHLLGQLLYAGIFLSFYPIYLYEYNIVNCIFVMGLIFLEEKKSKSDLYPFMQGILIGCIFLTKQTTGLISMVVYIIIFCLKKKKFKEGIICLSGLSLVISIFFLFLVSHNLMGPFVEYTVLGVGGFTKNFRANQILGTLIVHPSISLLLLGIGNLYLKLISASLKRDKKADCYLKENSLYYVIPLSVIFPLFDHTHFVLGLLPAIPASIVEIEYILSKGKKARGITIALIISCIMLEIAAAPGYLFQSSEKSTIPYYKGIPISLEKEEKIADIKDYVETSRESGREVYILDGAASLYFTPLNLYHKDYDMMFRGNIGANKYEELIRDICRPENIILIPDDEHINYQMPTGIKEVVVQNGMIDIGTLNHYRIYAFPQ